MRTKNKRVRADAQTSPVRIMAVAIFGFALLLIAAAPTSAAPVIIDFEGLPLNTSITSVTAGPVTAGITANGGIDEAWIYDTRVSGADDDLKAPLYNAQNRPTQGDPISPGNVLIIQENAGPPPDDAAGGGTLTFMFDDPVTLFQLELLDVKAGEAVFTLLNTAGGVIGIPQNNLFDGDSGDNPPNWYERIVFGDVDGVMGVKTLEVVLNDASGAIDNILVEARQPPAVVPLPAAVWLFLSALGVLGYLGKKGAEGAHA